VKDERIGPVSARRPQLLITGATGLLGCVLAQEAVGHYETWGIARHPDPVDLPCSMEALDLVDGPATAERVQAIAPDVVIHAAAFTSVDGCERDPERAVRVNVEGTKNLLSALKGHACRFVFISTDSVFDGGKGQYSEDDRAVPIHVYGRTKLQAEEAVLHARPNALVVRTVFYGWNVTFRESLAEWIVSRLRAGQVVTGFQNARFSPLLTNHLARLILKLVATKASGILHVASPESRSKYEFAARLADLLGYAADRVVPTQLVAGRLAAPRPLDTSLCVERATAILGHELPGIEEGLRDFVSLEASVRQADGGSLRL
jgi:dTDP-4-dehydrorhamnose reductase